MYTLHHKGLITHICKSPSILHKWVELHTLVNKECVVTDGWVLKLEGNSREINFCAQKTHDKVTRFVISALHAETLRSNDDYITQNKRHTSLIQMLDLSGIFLRLLRRRNIY